MPERTRWSQSRQWLLLYDCVYDQAQDHEQDSISQNILLSLSILIYENRMICHEHRLLRIQ